jgi:hypothetical protein
MSIGAAEPLPMLGVSHLCEWRGRIARATRTNGGECAHFAGAKHPQNEHFVMEVMERRDQSELSFSANT